MPVYVSDHAVLRYLERRHEIPVNSVRDKITQLVWKAVALKADSVKIDGVTFRISYTGEGAYVTTALAAGMGRRTRKGG